MEFRQQPLGFMDFLQTQKWISDNQYCYNIFFQKHVHNNGIFKTIRIF